MPPVRKAIVLGGGISGMAISRCLALRGYQVTCVEKSDKFGGWISSKRSKETGALLEQGPHSLRPRAKGNGLRMVQLLQELGLENEALCSQGTERFVYADSKMIKLPSSLRGVFTNPLTRKLPVRVALESLSLPTRKRGQDSTIGDFIQGRFGMDMKLLISAMVAGIFAGDVDNLSVKSCFPDLVNISDQGSGSLVRGMLLASRTSPITAATPAQESAMKSPLVKASGITFKDGMGFLAQQLEFECRKVGVEMLANAAVTELGRVHQSNQWAIKTSEEMRREADLIFSTLSPSLLSTLLGPRTTCSELETLKSLIGKVDVAVVNLVYAQRDVHLPPKGFGHLVANRDVQAEMGCLGVIYDSNAFPAQQPAGLTVLSVMLGGAHAAWVANKTENEWISLAKRAVLHQMHIGVKPLEQCAVLHRNCIPQYQIGHSQAATDVRRKLEPDGLIMLGTGVLGAGIADSVGGALLEIESKF